LLVGSATPFRITDVWFRVKDEECEVQSEEELLVTADPAAAAKRAVLALAERRLDQV